MYPQNPCRYTARSLICLTSEHPAKSLPSSRGKEEPRRPQNLRGRSHDRVPKGGGIHAPATDIEIGILVAECYRMREYDIRGVNAGADDYQPPDSFAGGGHGGHEAVHRVLFRSGGTASH